MEYSSLMNPEAFSYIKAPSSSLVRKKLFVHYYVITKFPGFQVSGGFRGQFLYEVSAKGDISFQVMRFPRFSDVS